MLDPVQTEKAKQMKRGEKWRFNFVDGNGNNHITSWGLPVPELILSCTGRRYYAKIWKWGLDRARKFIFASLSRNVSIDLFEREMYDISGFPFLIGEYINLEKNKEYKREMEEARLIFLKDSVDTGSDYQLLDLDKAKVVDKELLRSKSLINTAKSLTLMRLENKSENLNLRVPTINNLATIAMPPKEV